MTADTLSLSDEAQDLTSIQKDDLAPQNSTLTAKTRGLLIIVNLHLDEMELQFI